MRTLSLYLFLCILLAPFGAAAQSEFEPGGVDAMRIENEDKLSVPLERTEEVWAYIVERFVTDQSFLTNIDVTLASTQSDEYFSDVYFDSPDFTNMQNQNGLRHRKRVNPANEDDNKELMQIKLNGINPNDPLSRAEYKYDIDYPNNFSSPEDRHPIIGIVDSLQRADFIARVRETLKIDPYQARPVLTLNQHRRRVYITQNGVSAFTISFDEVSSTIGDTTVELTEIEPEINEIMFTEGDEAKRAYLKNLQAAIITDIQTKFPFVQRDLTPKYNKVFARFEAEDPTFRMQVFVAQGANYFAWGILGVLGVVFLAAFAFFSYKRRRA